jgi:AcrR family transcriptional regulator
MDSEAAVPLPEVGVGSARPVSMAQSTRDVLVELAAEVFASEGYASASVRDLSRRAGVTSGAIYGNFRGKADLLVEAVDARILTDLWTLPDDVVSQSMLEIISYQFEHYREREQLMSLLIEGAMAARAEPDVQTRLKAIVQGRLDASTASIEERRAAEGYQDDVSASTVAMAMWSIDIGLRVLTALGVSGPDPAALADVVRHFLLGLQDPDVRPVAAAPAPAPAPAAKVKTKKPKTKSTGKK